MVLTSSRDESSYRDRLASSKASGFIPKHDLGLRTRRADRLSPMSDPLLQLLDPVVGVVLLACGAVAVARRPKSRVGMLMVAAGGC